MSLSRRDLLALAATMPALAWLPRTTTAAALGGGRPPLPHAPAPDDEAAWEQVAREFLIEGLHLNTGTYGACPIPVLEATIGHMRAFERMTRQEGVDRVALRAELEAFLGAWPGSVAVVRNTTEAMNIVAAGITLQPGDEVLTTTHEHIGGRCCWELAAKRHGIVLRTFTPPLDPSSEAQLAAAWMEHVTPRTRVLSISHVLFTTGLVQPVEALVRMAREKGIISVIDGAHPPGMLALDLQRLDADYYASSPHKWLLAPKGTGLLVTRPDRLATTWPLIASGEWDVDDPRKFEHVGTGNDSLLAGLRAAVAFQQAIGREAIEARVHYLAARLDAALRKVPGVQVVSPRRPEFRGGMVSFTMDGVPAATLQRELGRDRIRTRVIAEGDLGYLRLSTHLYVLPRDLDRVVGRLGELARG
jgi:L-cysteine/cystine lyase